MTANARATLRASRFTAIALLATLSGAANAEEAAGAKAPVVAPRERAGASFTVSFPAKRSAQPLDGRVILLLSRDLTREPRTHVEADEPLTSPYVFGLNVDGLAPGRAVSLDDHAFGWPVQKLSQVPAGDYLVQAVLNRYETFHLADGRTLKLPPDRGEGQQWAKKPGNLFSTAVRVHVDPAHPARVAIMLDQEVEPRHCEKRFGVHPSYPDAQRVAIEILGARRLHRRARARPEGFRQTPRGPLPAHGLPRPLPR